MNYKFLPILFLFVLGGCLPEQEVREPALESNSISDGTGTDDTGTGDDSAFGSTISWLNSGISSSTLTVNIDNAKSIYLIGDQVHNYLLDSDNFRATYCMEVRFTQTANNSPKRLRVKVSPGFSNQFTQGKTTRFLTVNAGTEFGNDFCNKKSIEIYNGKEVTIDATDSNYDGSSNGSDIAVVLKTSDICTNCVNIFSSSEVILYKYDTTKTALRRVDTNKIDYSPLVFRIDSNSNSNSGTSSCTNSECISKGFDCCSQGQCINEKTVKISGVNTDPTGFATAEQEKFTDQFWYKKYPQYYYACLESPPEDEITPTPVDPVDPIGDATTRLEELIADYNCIEELKTNSEATPFHKNPINGAATYNACDISSAANTNYYINVMTRLYQNCGCSEKTDFNLMVANCPAYTYKPIYQTDTNGNPTTNIVSLSCESPPLAQTPIPFQNMEVVLNSRSAPHRFFDTNNIEIDPGKPLPTGASGIQEGEEFQYLDNFYIFPRNGSYNMNSILGTMNIQLNMARPAFKVDLEFDRQYMIATRSGFYQGCPTCAKDSWFNNFSAFPFSNTGVGIQAVGYTTTRDTFGSNSSLGSYGDTKFGRACFVPPTMIAYSHQENTNTQTQRLNRLKTQAALFANGYQRDWYGFNRGALIGSFDGVTWFAIGKGRLVKSTSNVLYLAINAPFADLASPTNHIVSVQEYDFTSTAAQYDYDPTLAINATEQNEAGSCQEWHKCETDAHCVSKLGWEYTCADVSYQRTNWPQFEALGAGEIASAKRIGTLTEFLQQGVLPPGSSSKRCVYRGAGAPCRIDYTNITDQGLRENLTCAPNFYCAALNSTNVFNDEVARFGRPLNELVESKNHIYGMDANILGRPKNYISTGNLNSLPGEVVSTLNDNLILTDSSGAGQFGLCLPGKKLPDYQTLIATQDWEPSEQHKAPDNKFRTDYINQIAGCNAALYTDLRYSSCPMIDETGDYIHIQDDFINDNFLIPGINTPQAKQFVVERYSFAQNSCGLESLDPSALPLTSSTSDELKAFSAFKSIEGSALSSSNLLFDKTMAMDSCQRKAGAVCHTDLDCSPNKLMADVIDLSPLSRFGNQAEKTYFEEFLICGQARREPAVGDADFLTYNIHNNRCCRPIGESITMFTEDSPRALESANIDTSRFGSINPTAADRYSRYSVVDSNINELTKKSNIIRPTANSLDSDGNKSIDSATNITNSNQWKTVHDAAAKTCCGGGWIRKFEDGTNDWTRSRLNINPANFKCINYRTQLFLSEDAAAYGMTQSQLDNGKRFMCDDVDQDIGGCAQHSISKIQNFNQTKPTLDQTTTVMRFNSDNQNAMAGDWENNLWAYSQPDITPNKLIGLILDWENFDSLTGGSSPGDGVAVTNISFTVPAYVTYTDFDAEIAPTLVLTDPDTGAVDPITLSADHICVPANIDLVSNPPDPSNGSLDNPQSYWDDTTSPVANSTDYCPDDGIPGNNNCCYLYDPITRVLRVAFSEEDTALTVNYGRRSPSVKFSWEAVGTLAWEQKMAGGNAVTDTLVSAHRRSSSPGNAMYYLKKLAKLEYLGIPQMTYEPIYCNDNYQNLVPGIFNDSIKTVMDFIASPKTFDDFSVLSPWNSDSGTPAPHNADALNLQLATTQELVEHPAIFSDNQFQCCLELGTSLGINDANTRCCSGLAVVDDTNDQQKTCMLPVGTNLNVYFNKFVSGEGISTGLTSPLTENDFVGRTGEPKTTNDVILKLNTLGEEFCESKKTRTGGAFGTFAAQIQSRRLGVHGILDDINDDNPQDSPAPSGFNAYQSGFKWNHQVYCDVGDDN